jgi:thiol-disulfide isomerase/thioredoxin
LTLIFFLGNNNINDIRNDLIQEFSKQKLVDKSLKSEMSLKELLSEKMIGFFFDASWCLPGRSFCNEILISAYNQAKKENLNFEIVYVSLVFDEKCLKEVFAKEHPDWFLFPNEKIITK